MEADPDSSAYSGAFLADASQALLPETESAALYIGITAIIWLVIALFASAVYNLSFLNGSAKELLTEKGDPASRRFLKLLEEQNEALLTINSLLVIAIVTFVALVSQTFSHVVFPSNAGKTVPLISTIGVGSVMLILGFKVIPRIVSTRYSVLFAQSTSLFFFILHWIFSPLSRPITRLFKSSLSYGAPRVQYLSGDDLKAMADIGEAQGTIEEDEREFIHSIMDLGDTTVREIMISRLDINALPITASLLDALTLIQSSGHSRLPVYEDHLDNIIGFVYVKDLLPYISTPIDADALDWRHTVREPFFVPASKPLDDLLRDFQARKMHVAIVVDDYGGTAGLVTMEDVLEEIVGDIRDEYDEAETDLHEKIDDLTHIFDARINLDDLSDLLNIELDSESYDFETLGGLIFHLKGEIPGEGDKVVHKSMTLRIESVENHRIGRVIIQLEPPSADKSMVA